MTSPLRAYVERLGDTGRGRPVISVEKLCLTPGEAAQVLSVGRTMLYELLKRGEIASISVGGARRIPIDSLRAYIAAALRRGAGV